MYTIKQAAARTGLSVPIIRVWERRYGIVQPSRTPAGYRLYDDASIARLSAMRRLVAEEGWQPRQAAQHVLGPGFDLGASSIDGAGSERNAASPGTVGADRSGPSIGLVTGIGQGDHEATLVQAFRTAAHELDVPAMERILDESFASHRFELAIEGLVSPALRAIGSEWAQDEIDVGAEHAASETVRRRLARFFDAAGLADRVPEVIVGMPPGGHHEIGAFAFAVAARRAGIDVLYLGANVPRESWLRTVRETAAPIVVLGVVTAADSRAASEVVEGLRAAASPPVCLIGGPLAADSPTASGTVRLPPSLDEAVATVIGLLGSRRRLVR